MPKSGRSYTLRKFESGDVEILHTSDKKQCVVTIHCEPTDGKDGIEIDLQFFPMSMDRVIGLLTPFIFEIRDFGVDDEDAPQ